VDHDTAPQITAERDAQLAAEDERARELMDAKQDFPAPWLDEDDD
jgi:hypothetical protein